MLPSVKFGTFSIIPQFSVCQPESIGILIVKIVQTVEKLFSGFFTKISRLLRWTEIFRILMIFFCSAC
jgi:hypothetical protein